MNNAKLCQFGFTLLTVALVARSTPGEDAYELPPIEYSRATPDNRLAKLQATLETGEVELEHSPKFGRLTSLLKYLEISPASQMLVFSKTSMQRERIAPRTPRAIYFDDDVYVGYCHAGKQIELAVADPQLGAVFYTLDQSPDERPKLVRETHRCLQCHGAAQSDDIPGFLVRSLFVDSGGQPILSEGSHRVDHATPLKDRWGGWYVTGTHGRQHHLGNLVVRDRDAPKPWEGPANGNVLDLADRIHAQNYPAGHSDLVALMVFEHQTHLHNLIAKANFTVRQALHYQLGLNRALGDPDDNRLESTTRRIESAGEDLVKGLMFVDEARLVEPIAGTTRFADDFSSRGPSDRHGRSLRELDLRTRLFRYPCSYMIYSAAFEALPPEMKAYFTGRLHEVLDGNGGSDYAHLSAADRQAITEILQDTKPEILESD